MLKNFSTTQQEILHVLKSFPEGLVYTIAPKQYVLRGYDYYKRNRLQGFESSKDFPILTAKIRGQRLYSVSLSVDGKGLLCSCNCPAWTPASNCKHVICALITIKNLLKPETFKLYNQDETYRELLLKNLYGKEAIILPEKDKAGRYFIVIEKDDFLTDLYITKDGKRLNKYKDRPPRELHNLLFYPHYSTDRNFQELARLLNNSSKKYPVIFKSDGKETEVQFDDSLQYTCKTELDASKRYIKVTRLCLYADRPIDDQLRTNDFVFHPEPKTFGLLRDKEGWEKWKFLLNTCTYNQEWDKTFIDDSSPSFKIPHEEFNEIPFVFPSNQEKRLLDSLIFKVKGRDSTIESYPHTYKLTIIPAEQKEDICILRAECNLDTLITSPSYSLFKFFVLLAQGFTAPFQANKRKIPLYSAFFDMLSAKTKNAAENIIKKTLSGEEFRDKKIKKEARKFLREHLSIFQTDEKQLQSHNGKWSIVPVNKESEILLYKIPYEIFGWRIFRGMRGYDEMAVSVKDLYKHLPLLYERLRGHGIALFFKNKPLIASTWDFAFDASRTSGIDWLEVKPEIKCNGEAIDDSLWMDMIDKKKLALEKDDCIQIMDSNSQKILNAISAIYKAGNMERDRSKEIVKLPRLQILDWISLRKSGVSVKLSPEDEAIIARLSQFKMIEKKPLPKRLKARLRPYQKDGYYWLLFLYEHRFGACLADDMGLGKTIQAISLLGGIKEGKVKSHTKDKACPHLIILPPSLLFNWENEILKFYPDLNLHFYTGKERNASFESCDVVLTTYGIVRRDIDKLKEIRFNVIIFDEAQAIKNISADTTGAVRQLKACFKLSMTGTPVENHLGEYYSIIDLSLPGLLGEYEQFKPLIKSDTSPSLDLIIKRTRPFVLRRTKKEILKELPPKVETDIYLDLTERQKALYKKTIEQVKSRIDDAYKTKTAAQAKIIALTAILQLRQLCVSPRLLNPELKDPSPKIDFLLGKLKELFEENHSVLVFSQFTTFLNIVEEDLKKNHIDFLRLDGSTPVRKRKKLVEEFQNSKEPSVFLLSLKAGGQGLNLTKASYVFHLDPWWNPAVENQASDRAHRIGQIKAVTITRILMHHTIEEKMMFLKKKKLALYKAVLEDSSRGRSSLSVSKSDFDFLLS